MKDHKNLDGEFPILYPLAVLKELIASSP